MTTPDAHARASMEVIAASLRRERRRTGLSLSEIARQAGLSKSTLSQLEAGIGNPSLETLWALCIALDAPFSRLVDPPAPRPQLIRAGEGPAVPRPRPSTGPPCWPPARRERGADIYFIAAEPGRQRTSEPHLPGVVEHVVLSTGRALVGLADEPFELGPGDYTAYPADVPHVFRALEPSTKAVLDQ